MLRATLFLLLAIAAICAANNAFQFAEIEDENLNSVEVEQSAAEDLDVTFSFRHYTHGHRVHGDTVVSHQWKTNHYWWPKDKKMTFHYPMHGHHGRRITYFEMSVNQTNHNGRLAITGGGIGQTYISMVLYAYKTKQFDYNLFIYGI